MSFASACKRKPFSNGTEGEQWTSKWCDHCVHDHAIHEGGAGGCDLFLHVLMGAPSDELAWPEAWLPEPDDDQFHVTPRVVCLRFEGCTEGGCSGDPAPQDRADLVAEVRAYWREAPR